MNAKLSNLPPSKAVGYIADTSFCSIEEAVEYVKTLKAGAYDVWKAIFNRDDFKNHILKNLSITDSISYANKLAPHCVWVSDVWQLIVERPDLKEYLLTTLSPKEAVEYAKESDSHWIWKMVIERSDVTSYLTTGISASEAVEYAKKIKETDIWVIVLQRADIDPKSALGYGIRARYDDKIWGYTLFKREDVKEFLLEKLSIAEVLSYLEEVNYWRIWGFIFQKRNDLPVKEAVELFRKLEGGRAKAEKDYGIDAFLMKQFWHTLSKEEAFTLAKELNYPRLWKMLFIRTGISKGEALEMAEKENNIDIWKGVLYREDISEKEASGYAGKLNDSELWQIIYNKKS